MEFELDCLAVGTEKKSGDAILMRYGDLNKGGDAQTVVLIDGGYKSTAQDIKEHLKKYYKCVNDKERYQIDLMILSHPDMDHVSGLVELTGDPEVQICSVLMHRPWVELTPTWFKDGRITPNSLKKRLEESFQLAHKLDEKMHGIKKLLPSVGDISLGGAVFHILGPSNKFYRECIATCEKTPEPVLDTSNVMRNYSESKSEESYKRGDAIKWYYDENTSKVNDSSLIILFEYDNHNVLLTGDAGKDALIQAINYANENGIDLTNIDLIKMPHHGSRKNVSPEIMDCLGHQGTACYFSCAPDDLGHHPSKRLINMLNQKGFNCYVTQGHTICHSHNAPTRNWRTIPCLSDFSMMDK